jgi:transposase
MWVPPEDADPIVLHAPTRKSIAVFGAVRIDDGRLVASRDKKFDALTFLTFLEKLLRHRRKARKMVVVLDNARYHHARLIQPWLKIKRNVLQLLFLPPYSPELNPVERVWKLTRRVCTHNRYFPTLDEVVEAVFNQFDVWSKPNDTLRRLCAII